VRVGIDQRTTTLIELNQTFLDQRAQFETSTNFVDDLFFFSSSSMD
jgi:hypothetical protein